MKCSLSRLEPNDGAGISGALIMSHFRETEGGDIEEEHGFESPTVGWHIMMQNLCYWYRTSPITEIVKTEEVGDETRVTFKTRNSVYLWRRS